MASGSLRAAAAEGGLWKSFAAIGRQEGLSGFWRGNLPQARGAPPFVEAAAALLPPAPLTLAPTPAPNLKICIMSPTISGMPELPAPTTRPLQSVEVQYPQRQLA